MQNTDEKKRKEIESFKLAMQKVCVESNLTRRDFLGDTYTTMLAITTGEGTKDIEVDVTHVRLPFERYREKAVADFYNLSSEEISALYRSISAMIPNNINLCHTLHANEIGSIMSYYKAKVLKSDDGNARDIYYITKHMPTMRDTYFDKETTVGKILTFGIRALKMVKDVHAIDGTTIRAIDPTQIYVDEDGKLIFACFQYAYCPSAKRDLIPFTNAAPLHIHESVLSGEAGTLGTDMYTVASMLSALLNGDGFDYQAELPDGPKYAPDELKEILAVGLTGADENFSVFRKKLSEFTNASKKSGFIDTVIPVPKAPSCLDTYKVEGSAASGHDQARSGEEARKEASDKRATNAASEPNAAVQDRSGAYREAGPEYSDSGEHEGQNAREFANDDTTGAAETLYAQGEQRLCRIASDNDDIEIDLQFPYHKKKYFFRQVGLMIALFATVAAILCWAVATNRIPLW